MSKPFPLWRIDAISAPGLIDGHRQMLESATYVIPDPREPGKLRVVEITTELVIRLLPDDVEVTGDLTKWGLGQDRPDLTQGQHEDLERARAAAIAAAEKE